MTDSNIDGRIDLRSLDPDGVAQREAIIAHAVRIGLERRARERDMTVIGIVARWAPTLLTTAAVLMLAALVALRTNLARESSGSPNGASLAVASWMQGGRVPSNGEVLAVFGGYGR